MQKYSVRNDLAGQPDLLSTNKTPSTEAHMGRNRYGSNAYGFLIPAYNEVQSKNEIRSCLQDQTTDLNISQTNQANQEMNQPHEQDMEIGYEDSPPPPTYEGLEQRFLYQIMKLAKERSDAEDEEFARHQQRILEINREYQEKVLALRAQQAARREEFLQKELQARLDQYHKAGRNYCPNMKVPDSLGYMGPLTLTAGEATSRFHAASEYKHDGERTLSSTSGINQGSEARVPLPPGRVYNSSAVYH